MKALNFDNSYVAVLNNADKTIQWSFVFYYNEHGMVCEFGIIGQHDSSKVMPLSCPRNLDDYVVLARDFLKQMQKLMDDNQEYDTFVRMFTEGTKVRGYTVVTPDGIITKEVSIECFVRNLNSSFVASQFGIKL